MRITPLSSEMRVCTQAHRQIVFFAGHGEHFDEAVPLQSDPVEKPLCSHRHQPTVHGHFSVLGQIELVFPNLFGA